MSDLARFKSDVRSLQVMSPERIAVEFDPILEGSSNFHEWKMEFETKLFSMFAPLNDYYRSEFHEITDNNDLVVSHPPTVATVRLKYNLVLLDMLKCTTSGPIKKEINKWYKKGASTDENIAKSIIKRLEIVYGTMTFEDTFKLVLDYQINWTKGYSAEVEKSYNGSMKTMESPILFRAAMLLASGNDKVREESLRKYGHLTAFDEDEFFANFEKLVAKFPKTSAAFIQTNNRKNGRRSNEPFCTNCKGKHWKSKCPKNGTQSTETANLAEAYPDSDLITSDHSAWMAITDTETVNDNSWYLDSGCTSHIGNDRTQFSILEEKPGPTVAGIANSVKSSGSGKVQMEDVTLGDTLYIPESPCNLVSISKMTQKLKQHVIFTESGAYLTKAPLAVIKSARKIGTVVNGLYRLSLVPETESAMWSIDINSQIGNTFSPMFPSVQSKPDSKTSGDIWHARLGHPGRAAYECAAKRANLPTLPTVTAPVCSTCALSKGKIKKGKTSSVKATAPLQLIQADICGSFRYHDYIDSKYFLTIIDRYSSYYVVIPLTTKSQATNELKNWIVRTENHFATRGGYKVAHVRTDNGGEFTGHILHDFFNERGITHELTVPHSSSQNGGVERAHGVLQAKMRTLLLGGRVPPFLWSEALLCAAYLHNRTPILGKKGKIPYLYWNDETGHTIDLEHLRTFGCAAYITLPMTNREGKLLPTSLKGVMVGYDTDRQSYRIYLPQKKEVVTSKDVRFDEYDYPLADTEASHQAYDFATGVLRGAPPYPKTANIPELTEGHSGDISSMPQDNSVFPSASYDTGSQVVTNSEPSMSTPPASPTMLTPSSSTNDTTTSSSSGLDTSGDPEYFPSRDIPSPPLTPSQTDVDMPDYVPDQTDHIEYNTGQLMRQTQQLVENQQATTNVLGQLLHQLSSSPESPLRLNDVRDMMDSLISQRLTTSGSVHPPEAVTVAATPSTPIVETPNSSPPGISAAPGRIQGPEPSSTRQDTIHTGPSRRALPAPATPTPRRPSAVSLSLAPSSSSSDTSDVLLIQPNATKRLHSMRTPAEATVATVSPKRGELMLHPSRQTTATDELTKLTPPPKRHHPNLNNTTPTDDSALHASESFAVGDCPIPVFGTKDTVVPFREATTDHVYAFHSRTDENNLAIHPAITALVAQIATEGIPNTVYEAQKMPDKKLWKAACEKEINALVKTKTFSLVDPPKNRRAIPSKWVFNIKDNGLHKARIVVQGFRQVRGIDYQATFAPVIRYDSVRLFLALAASKGLTIHQMDVVTAFLNSPIDTDIFVKPPPGFDLQPGKIWKLNSALYGLKQSPQLWNNHIKGTLNQLGFKQNPKEFGLYYRNSSTGLCLIALYVDDLLIASSSSKEINNIKEFLNDKYEMKDLGQVNKFLGMNIIQTNEYISLSLKDYMEKKAKEYSFKDLHATYNPLQKHVDYYANSPPVKNITSYQSLIGTLIFVANAGRPDVAHSVSFLSRFLKDPREVHYTAARRVFNYLYTTREQTIVYKQDGVNKLICYSDASYADCPDRKSTYGYLTTYASGPVTWCSKKMGLIVTSSTQAELVAASEATKEIMWLDQVLKLMDIKPDVHVLYMDNQPSLKLADHPVHHSNTKHIDIKHLLVREAAERKILIPKFVGTKDQLADIFTKILAKGDFVPLKKRIFGHLAESELVSTD